MLPTEAELVDCYFGRFGRLRAWSGDELLRARLVASWRELRIPPPIPWAALRQQAYADSGKAT
jgi:hypothetical protein